MVNVDKIKELAKNKGISITHLCSAVGQGPYYLNDVKNKLNGKMPDNRLRIIADKLGTTVEYLRDETDDPEIPNSSLDLSSLDPAKAELIKKVLSLSPEKVKAINAILRDE